MIILVLLVWGLVYLKKTIAFVYFGNGVKALNVSNDIEKAQSDFTKAIGIDETDVYWRAQVETMILATQKLAGSLNQNSSASTTQAVLTDINKLLNNGLSYAKKAVAYDPKNYYNYVSEARISEVASSLKMEKGYENAVSAYNSAINYNPFNPALYFALASFEAKNAKYDEAIQDLGKSLQVKNNYLDAIFLLSQIYAAKGDIGSALTASKVAVQLNPQNPVLLFQLGILEYNNKDYSGASQALTEAIKYQPDYSNAKYFLGLSEARLNNTGKAIALFEELANANPDNQELALILANLRNGKSVFNDAKPPVTTAPEKRSGLPIKEKK
jgi:tetratricopeptide (TPR) repeat protein